MGVRARAMAALATLACATAACNAIVGIQDLTVADAGHADGGSDASTSDALADAGDAASDASPDGGVTGDQACWAMGSTVPCRTCCFMNHANGANSMFAVSVDSGCACTTCAQKCSTATVCGGGTPTNMTMCGGCVQTAVLMNPTTGPCAPVAAACNANPECVAWETCAHGCP